MERSLGVAGGRAARRTNVTQGLVVEVVVAVGSRGGILTNNTRCYCLPCVCVAAADSRIHHSLRPPSAPQQLEAAELINSPGDGGSSSLEAPGGNGKLWKGGFREYKAG